MPKKRHDKHKNHPVKPDTTHNPNRMFHQSQLDDHSDAHNINITINVANHEDGVVGCFKACMGLFKKGG